MVATLQLEEFAGLYQVAKAKLTYWFAVGKKGI